VVRSCDHANKPSGLIKGGEFLDWLSDYQHLKKDSAAWSQTKFSPRQPTQKLM
jgi:hypothetical protein